MPRIACLLVPSFSLAAWYRAEPDLRGCRVAVAEGRGPRARLVAVSAEAARRGVAPGTSAAQALAIDADLSIRAASPEAERAAQAALCDVADSFSPRVEDAAPGLVYLDCTGSLHTFRDAAAGDRTANGRAPGVAAGDGADAAGRAESNLAHALAAAAQGVGLAAGVGIGSTKVAARLAAECGGATVIPAGEEWRFLEPQPVQLLQPDPRTLQSLRRWGIRTLGQLAALPAAEIATRLGPEGASLVRRARGEDERPLNVRPAPLCFEESAEVDYGIDSLEPFLFLLRGLLERLVARLALRGQICGDLRLSLRLANRARLTRTVVVAAPSNDVKALLTLLRLHLETNRLPEAVEGFTLAVVPERLRPMQLDLFRPKGPAPEKLALTLARLTALCGEDRVGRPVVADSHRPDAYGLAPFDAGRRETTKPDESPAPTNGATGCGSLALRAVRPPRRLEVFTERDRLEFVRLAAAPSPVAGGSSPVTRHPSPVTFGPSPVTFDPPRFTHPGSGGQSKAEPPVPHSKVDCACTGRVVSAAGPWRVQGEWWHAGAFERDYYDVQLSDGVFYRLYHDRRSREWFVDGMYD